VCQTRSFFSRDYLVRESKLQFEAWWRLSQTGPKAAKQQQKRIVGATAKMILRDSPIYLQ
jgi:hypothetical protein